MATDLIDYLRDKLEHADDPTPFRLNGMLLHGCTCPDIDVSSAGDPPELRRTVKGLDSRCPVHIPMFKPDLPIDPAVLSRFLQQNRDGKAIVLGPAPKKRWWPWRRA